MDCLVSNDHLSGTAVLKLAPEDEDEDTTIQGKSHRNTGHKCSVNIVEAAAGGYTRMLRESIRLEGWTHWSANLPPYGGEI